MKDNTARLLWAVPGAMAAGALAWLLGYDDPVPMILAAAMGAIGGFVIAGIAQEWARRAQDDRDNR
jgi:hypothetical protein